MNFITKNSHSNPNGNTLYGNGYTSSPSSMSLQMTSSGELSSCGTNGCFYATFFIRLFSDSDSCATPRQQSLSRSDPSEVLIASANTSDISSSF